MSPDPSLDRELAQGLGDRFYQRRDIIAEHAQGHWHPVDEPITGRALLAHLHGKRVLGTYLLDAENQCRFFTLDLDFNRVGASYRVDVDALRHHVELGSAGEFPRDDAWPDEPEACNPREVWLDLMHPLRPWLAYQMRSLAAGLAARAYRMFSHPVAVVYSGGKGIHVHVFCGTMPAHDARIMAEMLMTSWIDYRSPPEGPVLQKFERIGKTANTWRDRTVLYDNISIEVYPKQDALDEGGYGNLVRLPLGVHPVTKQRSYFINLESIPALYPLAEFDPLTALTRGCVIRDH